MDQSDEPSRPRGFQSGDGRASRPRPPGCISRARGSDKRGAAHEVPRLKQAYGGSAAAVAGTAASAAEGAAGVVEPVIAGDVVDGTVVAGGGAAVIHGAGLTTPRLELGPISSVLNGVEDEEDGAIMLDGIDPKPPPLADGAIVVPRSFKS